MDGDSSLKGNVNIDKDLTVKGNQTVDGDTHTKGNQTVDGDSILTGKVTAKNGIDVTGGVNTDTLSVTGESVFKGGVFIEKDGNKVAVATADDLATASQNLAMQYTADDGVIVTRKKDQILTVKGEATAEVTTVKNIKTTADKDGSIAVELVKDVNLGADGSLNAGSVNAGVLNTKGDAIIGGNSQVKGSQSIDKDLTVKGNSHVKGSQSIDKDLTVKGNSHVKGSQSIGKDLTVKGNSHVKGSQSIDKDLTVKGNSQVKGSQSIDKDLTVKGNSHVKGSQSIDKDLTVKGNTKTDTLSVGNRVEISANGIDAQGTKIINVADAQLSANSKDAVSGSQLYETNQAINRLNTTINNNTASIYKRIDAVKDDANAGVSSAMAMASLPQAFIPGKSMLTGGMATYNGQSAVAIGLSSISDNGRWVIKVSGSVNSRGNAGGSIGAGLHF
ncbi:MULTISPECIES: YadA family autotransporter adhesin [unclassified Mannheimia]|uniref:YadA family autotransporter adhesin n=1 Tax=unclassified Mannheimia TaxID=2645054 RepID=UPI00359CE24C